MVWWQMLQLQKVLAVVAGAAKAAVGQGLQQETLGATLGATAVTVGAAAGTKHHVGATAVAGGQGL